MTEEVKTPEGAEEQTSNQTDNEVEKKQAEEEKTAEELVAELEQKNKELYARLKREEKKDKKNNEEPIDVASMAEFFAKGGTREELDDLKVIMAGKGVSFAEAQKDNLFIAGKKIKELENKNEKAQITSSRTAHYDPNETVADRHNRILAERGLLK